jgi:hypothetical protein
MIHHKAQLPHVIKHWYNVQPTDHLSATWTTSHLLHNSSKTPQIRRTCSLETRTNFRIIRPTYVYSDPAWACCVWFSELFLHSFHVAEGGTERLIPFLSWRFSYNYKQRKQKRNLSFSLKNRMYLLTGEWLFVILAIGTAKYRPIHMSRINPQNADWFTCPT